MVVKVLISRSAQIMNQTFDYSVPQALESMIQIGVRVFVPIASSKEIGYVLDIVEESSFKLKNIIEVIDLEPIVTDKEINLAKLIAKRYFTSLSSALELMIPLGLRKSITKELVVLDRASLPDELKSVFINESIKYNSNLDKYNNLIKKCIKSHTLEVKYILSDNAHIKQIKYIHYVNDLNVTRDSQIEILNYLKQRAQDVAKEELIRLGYSDSSIKTLIKNGNLSEYLQEAYREVNIMDSKSENIILNSEQRYVFDEIKSHLNLNSKYLIHGVCGSGKTEVYLNLIDEVLKQGKEALLLVPEISLTPQISSRFKNKFGKLVALIHSNLSVGERYDEYRRIKRGEARVVIGVRSALFSPFNNLGIIIIDEEQEDSYIQDSTPYYDAHYVAEYLSAYYNCPLILGSATPKVTTYYKAKNNEYILLELKNRVNNKPLEESIVVDMRDELKHYNKSVFSRTLQQELINNFEKKEQSILFINRRGYSPSFTCRSCGETIKCPNCNLPLSFHKINNKLKCHYCSYETISPTKCPNCQSTWVKALGSGTEKVEEEIKKLLPEAKVLRIDSDTTLSKDSYNKYISQINNHECDIILGTQIVAKGLDFPLVSLVGVINADLNLTMPLYNAYEKTYDLLEQVSGRAGRKNTKGLCIIQTYSPNTYPIEMAKTHNYLGFYNKEIFLRKSASNPPFYNIFELMFLSRDSNLAYKNAIEVKKEILSKKTIYILGPVSDRIYKMNNLYRFILTIKTKEESLDILNEISDKYLNNSSCQLRIRRM